MGSGIPQQLVKLGKIYCTFRLEINVWFVPCSHACTQIVSLCGRLPELILVTEEGLPQYTRKT